MGTPHFLELKFMTAFSMDSSFAASASQEQPQAVCQSQICILGGGFAGLYTALRLNQLPWTEANRPTITLLDQSDRFVFLPLLYELVTGELQTWEVAPEFREILANSTIQFIQDTVSDINLKQQRVLLGSGRTLTYDQLVLALGGETPKEQVPGAADYAISFRSLADAQRLDEKLRQLEASPQDKIRVAIVGAGPSGVELACKLSDRLGSRGRVRLIDRNDQILKNAAPFSQQAAQQALDSRRVWIDLDTQITEVQADRLLVTYREQVDEIPVDIVMWTVGTTFPTVIQQLDLPKNARGQLLTTPTLQVVNYPSIFALGDVAETRDSDGQLIPGTAQAAFQQADYAGWNLWANLSQRPLLPFRYNHLGEMLTLGKDTAALSGLGIQLDGPPAYLLRRLAYLYRMPTLEHQLKVGLNWVLRPLVSWVEAL
jgi:demethylphylloquinone reductase